MLFYPMKLNHEAGVPKLYLSIFEIFSKPAVLHQKPGERLCSIHLLMRNPSSVDK